MKKYLNKAIYLIILSSFFTLASSAQDTVSYTYDALGRLTSASYSSGAVITYTYDPAGNRISKTVTGTGVLDPGAGGGTTQVVVLPIAGFTIIPIN